MWIFNDHIELWNEGKLPDSMSIDALTEKHSSHPRNFLIASVFYKAGFIESWGRGIRKINHLPPNLYPTPNIKLLGSLNLLN